MKTGPKPDAPPEKKTGLPLLFVYGGLTGFIQRDLAFLRGVCDLREVRVKGKLGSLWEVARRVWQCRILYIWFAGEHALVSSLLAKLFRKKIILVAGGFDVVSLPEIDYGSMRGGLRQWVTRLLFRWADLVVCVSESNRLEAQQNAGIPPEKIRLVRHGFPDTRFEGIAAAKEPVVLTVGEVKAATLKRKGLLTFAQASKRVPEAHWIMAGRLCDRSHELLRKQGGKNLTLLGYVSKEELLALFRKAKVYAQVSYHEGFGCSLAEAMLEEGVPVVTARFAIPEVVGDTGIYVPYGDPASTAHAVRRALAMPPSAGARARERVLANFPLSRWEGDMRALLSEAEALSR